MEMTPRTKCYTFRWQVVEVRMGKIVTFYSYKGGTGRSMAVANVGVVLARWGYRVLLIDWDFEAPGLESFFLAYLDKDVMETDGFIDFLHDVAEDPNKFSKIEKWKDLRISIFSENQTAMAPAQEGINGTLDMISAGQRIGEKKKQYFDRLHYFDIVSFYEKQDGGMFIEKLREDWINNNYDFVIIDSRTGVTDINGICTVQIPNDVVLLFTPTEQSISGTWEVGSGIGPKLAELPLDRTPPRLVPVASRFDFDRRPELGDEWLKRSARKLGPLIDDWRPPRADALSIMNELKIPHKARSLFGEGLPVLQQSGNDPASISYGYNNLAALLARDLAQADKLVTARDDYVRSADRTTLSTKTLSERDMRGKMHKGWTSDDRKVILSSPIVERNQDGRLQVFARRVTGALCYRVEKEPGSDEWSNWISLRGDAYEHRVIVNRDHRLEIFACGANGDLWRKKQLMLNKNKWSKWNSLGAVLQSAPALAMNKDGRLEVFIRGTNGSLWHRWQAKAGGTKWSNWQTLFSPREAEGINDPFVIVNKDGRLQVFVLGGDGALWHIYQKKPNALLADDWGNWDSLGGKLQSKPVVGRNKDGRLEVFVRGTDRALWHIHQMRPGSDAWSKWLSHGGGVHEPQVVATPDGRLHVFVRGNERSLWQISQTSPNDGWTDWKHLGGALPDTVAVAINAQKQIVVFVRGTDGALWRRFADS